MQYKLSASLMCADPLHLQNDLDQLAQARMDYLHMDVMDGHFVPNLSLSPDLINAVGRYSDIPRDIHLMVDEPETLIPLFELTAKDVVAVHDESEGWTPRTLAMVRERGAQAALAISPETPIRVVKEVLPDLSMVLLMTVNPGFAGQKMTPHSLERIQQLREALDGWGYPDLPIAVDGNCSFTNVPKMAAAGASIFVLGTSSIFRPDLGIARGVEEIRQRLHHPQTTPPHRS